MASDGQRILIAGGPNTGKTTLAETMGSEFGFPVKHTDDLIGSLDWSALSEEVSQWFDKPGPWIIEGVAAFRALRKWLVRNPDRGTPCDVLSLLDQPHVPLTVGQETMAKGCATVWREIYPMLLARDIEIRSSTTYAARDDRD